MSEISTSNNKNFVIFSLDILEVVREIKRHVRELPSKRLSLHVKGMHISCISFANENILD